MKPIHKLSEHDGRQFSNTHRGWLPSELADPIGLCKKLIPLLESQDPEDRREADRVAYLLNRAICCPDGVWVCKCVYAIDPHTGKRWSNSEIVWTAHLTKENAEAWHAFWTAHWKDKRGDYEMLPVVQQDRVQIHTLVHPDAKVGTGVSR